MHATLDLAELATLHAAHVAELERRYADVLRRFDLDAVVLHAGSLKLRSVFDDQYWPLRVTPHFQHWLPLEHPECAIVVAPGRRTRLVWPVATSFWEKPAMPECEHWRAAVEIVEVQQTHDVKAHLGAAGSRRAFIGDGAIAHAWGFAAEETNPSELARALDQLRTHKTPYEIFCIAEANRRASVGHHRIAELFHGDEAARSELDLHLLYLSATAQDDAETPYKNIVATGENAATLHHIAYLRRPREAGDVSLLLDAGATCLGYASDITRTYVKGRGAAAAVFAELVTGMVRLQQELCARIKIGLPYEELHEESHRQVAALLRSTGVVRASVEEMVETDVSRTFYPHGLGHSLGLQTHDVGCAEIKPKPRNPFLRNTSVISEGQVFTIEPGLYFIPGLLNELRAGAAGRVVDWRLVDELRGFGGIRIEDDVLVRAGAPARNLTREVLPA